MPPEDFTKWADIFCRGLGLVALGRARELTSLFMGVTAELQAKCADGGGSPSWISSGMSAEIPMDDAFGESPSTRRMAGACMMNAFCHAWVKALGTNWCGCGQENVLVGKA